MTPKQKTYAGRCVTRLHKTCAARLHKTRTKKNDLPLVDRSFALELRKTDCRDNARDDCKCHNHNLNNFHHSTPMIFNATLTTHPISVTAQPKIAMPSMSIFSPLEFVGRQTPHVFLPAALAKPHNFSTFNIDARFFAHPNDFCHFFLH